MVNPKVSICIPTRNGRDFIAETMDSAINQTYPNLEIVVSDDRSNDDTLEIIESFKSKTNIPISIFNHKPKTIGANWNNCIKNAQGLYIKFLFQDDILESECISQMVDILEKNDSIGLVGCQRDFIVEKNYENSHEWIEIFGDLQRGLGLKYEDGVAIIDSSLFKNKQFLKSPLNKIGEPSTFMFRKDITKKIGLFREDLHQILDYEFCYRLLKYKKIGILNKVLVKFRLHNNQTTVTNRNNKNKDAFKYSRILYKEYLSYVDDYTRIHLLKKHSKIYKAFYLLRQKLFKQKGKTPLL